MRTYENFDLLIEVDEAGRYQARITSCPVGDTTVSTFSLPFSPTELENLLLKLDPGRSGMRRTVGRHAQASMDLGSGLFDAVFRDEVLVAWSRSNDAVRRKGHGLRLRLRLAGAPSLAAMPWELLYDKSSRMFYAQSDRTPVVRYLDVTNPPRPLTVRGPLRILAVIASPRGLPRLDVEREWATICEALADKQRAQLVRVDRLPAPTIGGLQRWLRHNEVHVLHFVGHGYFDDRQQDGMLVFTDPSGTPAPISSAVLGTHVRDHDPLRLVVLNACQTARADDADPYSGMAQGLIQQEAAAVVAMQFPISDDAAIVFTHEFYGAVADGEPLDQAMASTRKALLADHGSEWATPVLFLRAPDGRIFDRIGDPGRPAQPRQQAPAGEAGGAGPPLGTAAIPSAAGPPGPPPASSPAARRPPPGRPRAPVPPARRPRRRRKYWLAGAATLLAAAVLTGIALISGGRAPTPDAASQSLASPSTPSTPRPSAPASGSSSQAPAPLTYRTYTNQRFGFTALRPASFTVKSRLPDGQGVTWVSPDGMVVLSAYGRENVHGYSPAADELADSQGLRVTYHPINGNVVTVSGYAHNGRTIVYRRDIVGPDAIDTLYWSYPTSARAQWDPAVTRTAHAFRPGDVGRTQPGAALTFKTYLNQRFGIAALWPASFRAEPPPADSQGETWVSPNGQAILSVYGANNLSHYSPEQDAVAASRGWLVTLRTIEGNVVTVSGYIHNRQTIVYRRDVVGPGAIDTMSWTYPASEKGEWAGAVTQTAHAFKAGDVTRVH